MSDIIAIFVTNFAIISYFWEVKFKNNHWPVPIWLRYPVYLIFTILLTVFLIIFGSVSNSTLTWITALVTFSTVLISEDTIEKIFGIKKNLFTTRRMSIIRLCILLFTPIVYVSINIVDRNLFHDVPKNLSQGYINILVAIFRLFFVELLFILLGIIYFLLNKMIPKGLLGSILSLSKNSSILNENQGFWYEIREYPIGHSRFLKSVPSFKISGSLLLKDNEAYKLSVSDTGVVIKNCKEKIEFKDGGECILNNKTFICQSGILFKEYFKGYSQSGKKKEKDAFYFILETDNDTNENSKNTPDLVYKIKNGILYELRTKFSNSYILTNWNESNRIIQGTVKNSKGTLGSYELNRDKNILIIGSIRYVLLDKK